MPTLSFSWDHGLGDTANLCRLLPLYQAAGFDFEIASTPDKAPLFALFGVKPITKAQAKTHHGWGYPTEPMALATGKPHTGNKTAANLCRDPLPNIGDRADLWELASTNCPRRLAPDLVAESRIRTWLAKLPRPIILLHLVGNTNQQLKSLSPQAQRSLYRDLLDRTDGTLVILDWDNRCPDLPSGRVRTLKDLRGCSAVELLALIDQSDLLIGVDSGPLHMAGLTQTPALGIYTPPHYPGVYSVPRPQTLNVTTGDEALKHNRFRRVPYHIVHQPALPGCTGCKKGVPNPNPWDTAWLADMAARMLAGPRYLPLRRNDSMTNEIMTYAARHGRPGGQDIGHCDIGHWGIAVDVQLQDWISHCGGVHTTGLALYADRNRSFDRLYRAAADRSLTRWCETGCIRMAEDWTGAGFSTYHFARYLHAVGGHLDSFDTTAEYCAFARNATREFGSTVEVHNSRGDEGLRIRSGPIDVLYLDSCDTDLPEHSQVCLQEVQAAEPNLHDRSLILFDDTPWHDGAFKGKGALPVPYLIDKGWRVLYAGYQVLLAAPDLDE